MIPLCCGIVCMCVSGFVLLLYIWASFSSRFCYLSDVRSLRLVLWGTCLAIRFTVCLGWISFYNFTHLWFSLFNCFLVSRCLWSMAVLVSHFALHMSVFISKPLFISVSFSLVPSLPLIPSFLIRPFFSFPPYLSLTPSLSQASSTHARTNTHSLRWWYQSC